VKTRCAWLPALAAPVTVLGHVVSEALASGRSLVTVAWEPAHLVLLIVAVLAFPLWLRAANARRLGYVVAAVVAISLLVEGNGLSVVALAFAVALSVLLGLLGGWAIECASFAALPHVRVARTTLAKPIPAPAVPRFGPYFAFMPTRGNRPPPLLLA